MRIQTNKLNGSSLSRMARRRGRIYRILATSYASPSDGSFLGILRSWEIPKDVESQGIICAQLVRGVRGVQDWFKTLSISSAGDIRSILSPEFIRLFRGLSRIHSPLPPYESVFLDNGRLYGASTDRVIEKYRQFQLKAKDNELPDHISLELDFMHLLCEKESELWKSGTSGKDMLREEDDFVNEHLMKWVPTLCENIRKNDITGFYFSLADITEGWLNSDNSFIKSLVFLGPEL